MRTQPAVKAPCPNSSKPSGVHWGLLASSILVSGVTTAVHADLLFNAAFLPFNAGGYGTVVSADFNSDGRPDVAVPNRGADAVSVLFGIGDGTLGERIASPAGNSPHSLATADLNADGRPDLAVATDRGVSVLLGNGDGTFAEYIDYSIGQDPLSVTIADLDADGSLDLLVPFAGGISVWLGNGDGTFASRGGLGEGLGFSSVAVADLNGDARPDLAATTAVTVELMLANGDGSFASHTQITCDWVHDQFEAIGIADLNADGTSDLVVLNIGRYNIWTMLGNGDGTFADKMVSGSLGSSGYGYNLCPIADVNADGLPDLAFGNTDQNVVNVLLGNGDGTFTNASGETPTGESPGSVTMVDLNADGQMDLAVSTSLGTICVSLGNPDGTFGAQGDVNVGCRPSYVAVADINNDGWPDLAATCADHSVSILLGNEEAEFGTYTDFETGYDPTAVAIGDLNGDTSPDLAVATAQGVSVLLGQGDGTFGVKTDYGGYGESVVIGDLNADGWPDLVSSSSVLLANGDGTFTANGQEGLYHVAISDLNSDNRLDLVGALYVSGNLRALWVALGNGDGTFTRTQIDFDTGILNSIGIADLNGDGRPDLALATAEGVSVLLGNGDGTFGASADYDLGHHYANAVVIADFNADAAPDLTLSYTSYNSPRTVSVLLGNGDGTFDPKIDFGVRRNQIYRGSSIAVADLNLDGRPDLAVTNDDKGSVFLLLNRGPLQTTPTLLSLFEGSWSTEGIRLRWQFGTTASFHGAELERGSSANGPWTRISSERRVSGETTIFLDHTAEAGRTYYYCLLATRRDGSVMTFGPLVVKAGQGLDGFELAAVAPSPTKDQARIDFTVAREAHVRLSVLDIQGRRVATLADAVYPAGRYQTVWDGRSDRGRAPAGLYLVRYEWPGQQSVRRLLLIN